MVIENFGWPFYNFCYYFMLYPFIKQLNEMKVILASQSPRRSEILSKIGLKFEIVPSSFEENIDPTKYSPV